MRSTNLLTYLLNLNNKHKICLSNRYFIICTLQIHTVARNRWFAAFYRLID